LSFGLDGAIVHRCRRMALQRHFMKLVSSVYHYGHVYVKRRGEGSHLITAD
jgi:hypothetical protein